MGATAPTDARPFQRERFAMSHSFDEDYLHSLPTDPVAACTTICADAVAFYKEQLAESGAVTLIEDHEVYLRAFALLNAYTATHPHDYSQPLPELTRSPEQNSRAILKYMHELKQFLQKKAVEGQLDSMRTEYSLLLEKGKVRYKFNDDDKRNIRRDIHMLRQFVTGHPKIEQQQRTRMLTRLGKLETELGNPEPDLDRFWGLVGEASLYAVKVQENADTIVNGIRRMLAVVWRVQCESTKLPTETPLIKIEDIPGKSANLHLVK